MVVLVWLIVHLDIFDEFLFVESCGLFFAWVMLRNFTPSVLLLFATMKLTYHFFINFCPFSEKILYKKFAI